MDFALFFFSLPSSFFFISNFLWVISRKISLLEKLGSFFGLIYTGEFEEYLFFVCSLLHDLSPRLRSHEMLAWNAETLDAIRRNGRGSHMFYLVAVQHQRLLLLKTGIPRSMGPARGPSSPENMLTPYSPRSYISRGSGGAPFAIFKILLLLLLLRWYVIFYY